ncbi:hypothetical protein Scep_008341 [Stephania cephalantha]|uniref:Uncharacterized protein n=1 Tax=Stephania cephalantha TaxID=152367 RepID=A0AAP0KDG4_9MAGN
MSRGRRRRERNNLYFAQQDNGTIQHKELERGSARESEEEDEPVGGGESPTEP